MLIHAWAFEIRAECDMMRCGLIIYFTDDCAIVGDADFVLDGDGATCDACLATLHQHQGAETERTD